MTVCPVQYLPGHLPALRAQIREIPAQGIKRPGLYPGLGEADQGDSIAERKKEDVFHGLGGQHQAIGMAQRTWARLAIKFMAVGRSLGWLTAWASSFIPILEATLEASSILF